MENDGVASLAVESPAKCSRASWRLFSPSITLSDSKHHTP